MTKKVSAVLLSILIVLILFFGVFTFLPDNIEYGAYGVYHAPVNLIQKGTDFGPSVKATYSVDTTDLADGVLENVDNIVTTRLNKIFNYYGMPVVLEGSTLSVTIPETASEEDIDAQSILEAVVAEGKVELLASSEYSEDGVLMSNYAEEKLFSGATTSTYVNGENTYYIVNIKMTDAGKKIAKDNFTSSTSSWSAYCAVDGVVTYGIAYSNDTLQAYASTKEQASVLAAYVNYGSLQTTLSETGYEEVSASIPNASLIFGIATLVLIIIAAVVLVAKFGTNGWAGVLSIVICAIIFTLFSGLAYFSVFNIYAWIGVVLGLILITYLSMDSFARIKKYVLQGNGLRYARKSGFNGSIVRNLIVNLSALVIGIILWVIPTGITLALGNALVYGAVLSLVFTLGVNRFFVFMLSSFAD